MQILTPEDMFTSSSVYYPYIDQAMYSRGAGRVPLELRALPLIVDRVILPTTHMIEDPDGARLCAPLRSLFQIGAFGCSVRKGHQSHSDFVRAKEEEARARGLAWNPAAAEQVLSIASEVAAVFPGACPGKARIFARSCVDRWKTRPRHNSLQLPRGTTGLW